MYQEAVTLGRATPRGKETMKLRKERKKETAMEAGSAPAALLS
jgi:hypothetical protein